MNFLEMVASFPYSFEQNLKKCLGEWIHKLAGLHWRKDLKRFSRIRYISEIRLILLYFQKLNPFIPGKRLH